MYSTRLKEAEDDKIYSTIVCCNTLQHTATHCNTLQHKIYSLYSTIVSTPSTRLFCLFFISVSLFFNKLQSNCRSSVGVFISVSLFFCKTFFLSVFLSYMWVYFLYTPPMHTITRFTLLWYCVHARYLSLLYVFFSCVVSLFSMFAGPFCGSFLHTCASFCSYTWYAQDDKIYSTLVLCPRQVLVSSVGLVVTIFVSFLCMQVSFAGVFCIHAGLFLDAPPLHKMTRSALVFFPRQVLVSVVGLFLIYIGLFSVYAGPFCWSLFCSYKWVFLHTPHMHKMTRSTLVLCSKDLL